MIQLKGEKMNEHHKKQIEVIREIEAQGVHRAEAAACYWLANYPG
jgi:hypothetical protein